MEATYRSSLDDILFQQHRHLFHVIAVVSHSISSEGSADSACENVTSFRVFTHETSLKAGILKMASLQELKSGKYWMIVDICSSN